MQPAIWNEKAAIFTCVIWSGELGRRLGSATASASVAPAGAARLLQTSAPFTHSTWKVWMYRSSNAASQYAK